MGLVITSAPGHSLSMLNKVIVVSKFKSFQFPMHSLQKLL